MGISSYIKISAVIILLSLLYSAKLYYTWSQNELLVIRENAVKLKYAIDSSENAVKSLQSGIVYTQKARESLTSKFRVARKENARLRNILSKHNLGFLASKKPKLIQTLVNKGTINSNRCFEIVSGSPLTIAELDASKPSQINSSCPSLANPNYIQDKK